MRTKAGGWKMPILIEQGGWGWGKGKWWFAIDEEKSTLLWAEKILEGEEDLQQH